MKAEIKFLMDQQQTGNKLTTENIRTLMNYALELLNEFEQLTQQRIAQLRKSLFPLGPLE